MSTTLILSIVIATVAAVLLGRIVLGVLKVALIALALIFILSVWHRGNLPWCGKKAPLFIHASLSEVCP